MSTATPLPIRLVQTLGISSSLILSGLVASLSISAIPRLLESPTPLLLRQWKALYQQGKASAPPLSALAASAYFYLAYQAHGSPLLFGRGVEGKMWAYTTAGLLCAGIVPYTLAVVVPTNHKLLDREEVMSAMKKGDVEVEETGLGGESVHQLVDWWAVLNLGRAVMLGASGVIGVWASLN